MSTKSPSQASVSEYLVISDASLGGCGTFLSETFLGDVGPWRWTIAGHFLLKAFGSEFAAKMRVKEDSPPVPSSSGYCANKTDPSCPKLLQLG